MTCPTCGGLLLLLHSFASDRAGRCATHEVMCPDCLPDPCLAGLSTPELVDALRGVGASDAVPAEVRGLALVAAARLGRTARLDPNV